MKKQDSSLKGTNIKARVAGSMTKSYWIEGGSQMENSRLCGCWGTRICVFCIAIVLEVWSWHLSWGWGCHTFVAPGATL